MNILEVDISGEPMEKSDELLTDLKKGDADAYRHLFYAYFTDLVCYAGSILKNNELAEDLVQELFITFWSEKKYRSIHSGLESYLYRSVRNNCLTWLRDEKRRKDRMLKVVMAVAEDTSMAFDELEADKESEEIFKAVHRLPEQCKKVFTLCCFEGLKYQEAADRLNVSINTVRTQMGRAFKFLRDTLAGKTFTSLFIFLLRNYTKPAKV